MIPAEQIPAWAVELTKQVAILNEKIPTHVDWVERNIKDHEIRLRQIEKFIWLAMGASAALGGTLGSLITRFIA